MNNFEIDINKRRLISQFFSSSFIKKYLINEDGTECLFRKLDKVYKFDQRKKLRNIYSDLYSELLNNYKCEYIFKNELFNRLLDNYHQEDVAYFDEFKINSSIADLICFNGIITIYEVKTDLDSLEKLNKQILDYKTIADEIYVVTTVKFYNKIIKNCLYDGVGIIVLTETNELIKVRNSKFVQELDRKSLFKLLLKKEVEDLMLFNFNFIPNTPNTIFLKYCFELLGEIEIKKFQQQIISKLKKRKSNSFIKNKEFSNIPYELKYIFTNLDINSTEIEILMTNLNYKNQCTHHLLEENNTSF